MKGTTALTPGQRKRAYLDALRAAGGRALHVYLTPEATVALERLRARGDRTVNEIVSEAIVAWAEEPPVD